MLAVVRNVQCVSHQIARIELRCRNRFGEREGWFHHLDGGIIGRVGVGDCVCVALIGISQRGGIGGSGTADVAGDVQDRSRQAHNERIVIHRHIGKVGGVAEAERDGGRPGYRQSRGDAGVAGIAVEVGSQQGAGIQTGSRIRDHLHGVQTQAGRQGINDIQPFGDAFWEVDQDVIGHLFPDHHVGAGRGGNARIVPVGAAIHELFVKPRLVGEGKDGGGASNVIVRIAGSQRLEIVISIVRGVDKIRAAAIARAGYRAGNAG